MSLQIFRAGIMTLVLTGILLMPEVGIGKQQVWGAERPSTSARQRKGAQVFQGMPVINLRGRDYRTLFNEVWQKINEIYPGFEFKGVDWQEVKRRYAPQVARVQSDDEFHQLLQRMVAELKDGHTQVVAPAQARQGSLPLELRQSKGKWVVASVKASPQLQDAGIQPGMELVSLNQKSIASYIDKNLETSSGGTEASRELRAVDQALRGPLGNTAHLTFKDSKGRTLETQLTYQIQAQAFSPQGKKGAKIQALRESSDEGEADNANVLTYRHLHGGWGYVQIRNFRQDSSLAFEKALAKLQPMPGLILDLRGNPGGIIGNGYNIVKRLIDKPIIGGIMVQNGQQVRFGIQPQGHTYRGPVAVLIDEKSMSTTELVSACLQDNQRAVLVGRPTAGAGWSPIILKLPTGAFISVSSKPFTRPNGRSIEGQGVKPDILVESVFKGSKSSQDKIIKAAIAALSGKNN
jgi:carboxyl-terminal processing protease